MIPINFKIGRRAALIITSIIAGIVVTACGGGNMPPEAVIAIDPAVAVPLETMTLDGSGSTDEDGEVVEYAWTQLGGSEVALSANDEDVVTFTVPNENTTLIFGLVVTDNGGRESEQVEVEIAVAATSAPGTTTPPASTDPNAVFVSASTGSDDPESYGSHDDPVATIERGLQLALQYNAKTVYVMEGTYEESVLIADDVDLIGCVSSVDSEGTPSFASSNAGTIIRAPIGSESAIEIAQAVDASVDCFTVIGSKSPNVSRAISVDGSRLVTLSQLTVETPGMQNAICRDIDVVDSENVEIFDSRFSNGSLCDDYAGVVAENVTGMTLAPGSGDLAFTIHPGGNEQYLKAIQIQGGRDVAIDGASIALSGGMLGAGVTFTGINATDSVDLSVADSDVDVAGGLQTIGISLRCQANSFIAHVEDNEIDLVDALHNSSGIKITCPQTASSFFIERNLIRLEPLSNQASDLTGIEVGALMRRIGLSVINNAIIMNTVITDIASKMGLELSMLAADSHVDVRHNTFLITGATGALYAIGSNRPDLPFTTFGNVLLVYGGNATNALFRLMSGCATSHCAKAVLYNLINPNVGGLDLSFAYYFDTAQTVWMSAANECENLFPPPQCLSGDVSRRDNVIQQNMKPSYFDFATGELVFAQQVLAKDAGTPTAGVFVDIDGAARNDGMPDIGAHEY